MTQYYKYYIIKIEVIRMKENKDVFVVTLVSRNKDNRDVPGFKQRNESFFTDVPFDSEILQKKFKRFVDEGVSGETSRMYYSINPRDTVKANRALVKFLVDNPGYDLRRVKYKQVSLAALPENATDKKWLFDFDINDTSELNEFVGDIHDIDSNVKVETYKTPNGYAVVTSRGFDSRKLFQDKGWDKKDVSLKRDATLCVYWETKASN